MTGCKIAKAPSLDLTRLTGFAAHDVTEVDFRDATFAARVGAKVGDPEPGGAATIDLSRLVGFGSVDKTEVNFRDATFAAKMGAKVGESEITFPRVVSQGPEAGELDLARLVGFAAVGGVEVDFRDETLAARVGAKIGVPEDN